MDINGFVNAVVSRPELHAKWLNTLSMMENSGARKIKGCEHPVFVNEVILKHASEEARHAYYLKKQIVKVLPGACPTYESKYLLAPAQSKYYLDQLDNNVCRYLKKTYNYSNSELKYAAYLLVTFAIEVRAEALYPIYKDALDRNGSKVKVNTIIAEEEGHLLEMRKQISELFQVEGEKLSETALKFEDLLYRQWVEGLNAELANVLELSSNA